MNRRISLFAALTFVGSCLLHAQDTPLVPPVIPAVSTSASQEYPVVTCTSADPLACVETLQLASDVHDRLDPLLKLGSTWRFPVHIHVLTAEDPLTKRINREAAATFAQGTTMKIEAVVPVNDPNAREFIAHQFVTALLYEKFFARQTTFDKNIKLDIVPVWLIEGLRESLDEDPTHVREAIVKRAVEAQTTPSLSDITGWKQMSDDRLLGMWQRAFCFYLVDSITQTGPRLEDFQQWLNGFAGDNPTAEFHFPTEADWQRELIDSSKRSRDVFYTWEQTKEELTNDQAITFAASKDAKVQTCTLDDVVSMPKSPALIDALKERSFLLTQLELRSHPSWHDILELYRTALVQLIDNDEPDVARRMLEEAHAKSVVEIANHQKLLDYMNWFEVTKDNADNTTHFGTYFQTAKSMEKAEADPTHPNPIRANLLQIESQL
jgi:hypothetical protein